MKKRIFAAIIIMALMSGTSWANLVYTTSNGKLGTIGIQSTSSILAPAEQYSGLGNNTFVASYWNGSESYIMVVNRTTDYSNASGDRAFRFKSSSMNSPLKASGDVLQGVYDTRAVASSVNGRGLFVASGANASIVEFDTSDLKYTRSYTYPAASTDYRPYALGVVANYNNVFALFDTGDGENSAFMAFDGQLKEGVENSYKAIFKQETYNMTWLSNSRIAASAASGAGLLSRNGFSTMVSADQPVVALCADNGDGFFFITQEYTDGNYVNTLYHRSSQTDLVHDGETGEICSLVNLGSIGVIAAIMGEKILLFNSATGDHIRDFDSTALGGVPVSMAYRYASGETQDTSSSSCNVGLAGMIMLAACSIITFKRR